MRNEQKRAQRKEAILDAFEALIKKYGIDKTTMQEIAKAVGISVGTLYNEFADKEALIDALIDRIEASLNEKVTNLQFSSESPDEQLVELLKMVGGLVETIIKENRSLADYVFSGSQNFRYVGKKIHQDFRKGALLTERFGSVVQAGVKAGVFRAEGASEAGVAITQAFTTYSVSRVLMDEKESKASKKNWDICFMLMIRGLRAK
jgi:AcrR family transcriptional regulator